MSLSDQMNLKKYLKDNVSADRQSIAVATALSSGLSSSLNDQQLNRREKQLKTVLDRAINGFGQQAKPPKRITGDDPDAPNGISIAETGSGMENLARYPGASEQENELRSRKNRQEHLFDPNLPGLIQAERSRYGAGQKRQGDSNEDKVYHSKVAALAQSLKQSLAEIELKDTLDQILKKYQESGTLVYDRQTWPQVAEALEASLSGRATGDEEADPDQILAKYEKDGVIEYDPRTFNIIADAPESTAAAKTVNKNVSSRDDQAAYTTLTQSVKRSLHMGDQKTAVNTVQEWLDQGWISKATADRITGENSLPGIKRRHQSERL